MTLMPWSRVTSTSEHDLMLIFNAYYLMNTTFIKSIFRAIWINAFNHPNNPGRELWECFCSIHSFYR